MKYKYQFLLLFIPVFLSCEKTDFELSTNSDDFFFIENEGAQMPVWVQGNTNSKKMVILLHGGPGGSSFIFDAFFEAFTRPLEDRYGVVYWEQRSSGTSQGSVDPESLTPEQFEADLSGLLEVLQSQYGMDVAYYLAGISWGGYLGNSWLINSGKQDQIKGWINIVGPHDFKAIANVGRDKLAFYANQQIGYGKEVEAWQEIQEWCASHPTISNTADFLKENQYANQADILMFDSLDMETPPPSLAAQLKFAFDSPFNSNAWLVNLKGIQDSNLIETLFERPLDCSKITIPTLMVGGYFDFVVPAPVLQDQFEQLSATEKSIHILPRSGHGLVGHEATKLVSLMIDFIDF
ncbi:MAG: alpha/beta hydrolase [Saprospiraceae bacterium]|nr:alpha/beta hydrolase [Saprospiraceae bacterium]